MFGIFKKRLLKRMTELSDIARNIISITLLEVYELRMDSEKAEILSSGVGNYLFGKELDQTQLETFSFDEIQSIGDQIIKNEPEIRELVIQSLKVISDIRHATGDDPVGIDILSIYGKQYPNQLNPKTYEALVNWATNNLTNPESEYISIHRDDFGKSPDTSKFEKLESRLVEYLPEAFVSEYSLLHKRPDVELAPLNLDDDEVFEYYSDKELRKMMKDD